jgi:hypothetical protein
MRSILKPLFRRHTTAVAYLALFVALGGSAYAAVLVTGKNIKDASVTGRDIKNRSLGANKLSAATVSALAGQRGPAGPQGPAGERGPAGRNGDTGPAGRNGDAGAVQFHIHADPNSVSAESPKVAGLSARILCTTPSGPTKVRVQLLSSTGQLDVSGSRSQDGALAGAIALTVSYYEAGGETSAGVDAIARQLPSGKWTSFQLGSYDRGAQGCDFWGVITPAT